MDWRSLTQVKELGVVLMNCSCLANDVSKIFKIYWDLGKNKSEIPSSWPDEYSTKFNSVTPVRINFTENFVFNTYFSVSFFFDFSLNLKLLIYFIILEFTTTSKR